MQESSEGAEGRGRWGAKTKPIWGEVDIDGSRVRAALGDRPEACPTLSRLTLRSITRTLMNAASVIMDVRHASTQISLGNTGTCGTCPSKARARHSRCAAATAYSGRDPGGTGFHQPDYPEQGGEGRSRRLARHLRHHSVRPGNGRSTRRLG